MKHIIITYLSLSTLLVSTVSTTTTLLRGGTLDDAQQDITAPPRLFEEHSLQNRIIEPPSSLSSSAVVSTIDQQQQRTLQTNNNECSTNEHLLSITLTSDKHSNTDNAFTVSTKDDNNSSNNRWKSLHAQSGEFNEPITLCIISSSSSSSSPNNNNRQYRFEALDSYSDGIDGGYYEVRLDGSQIFRTPGSNWSRSVHKFTVGGGGGGVGEEDTTDTTTTTIAGDKTEEQDDEYELEGLELMMGTGFPTSVVAMASPPNPAPATPKPTIKKPPPTPKPSSPVDVAAVAVAKPEPAAAAAVAVTATATATAAATTVSTGEMTQREHQWLDEHNVRREKYHTKKGKSYVPLQWSAYLRDSAQQWAEECAKTNNFDHAWHLNIGENMARHTTNGDGYRHPSNILIRWVENELNVGYPDNGHMTQALWRATKFVGCGEAQRGNRYYQVCQYSKPGNCGVKKSDYWSSVLADDSGCKGMPLLY